MSDDPILSMYKGTQICGRFEAVDKGTLSSPLLKDLLDYLEKRHEFGTFSRLQQFVSLAPPGFKSIWKTINGNTAGRQLALSFISECLREQYLNAKKPTLLVFLELLEIAQSDAVLPLLIERVAAELMVANSRGERQMRIVLISPDFSGVIAAQGSDLKDAIEAFWSSVWEQGWNPDGKILGAYGDWTIYQESEDGTLVPQERLQASPLLQPLLGEPPAK